jgi:hypothetical protein
MCADAAWKRGRDSNPRSAERRMAIVTRRDTFYNGYLVHAGRY